MRKSKMYAFQITRQNYFLAEAMLPIGFRELPIKRVLGMWLVVNVPKIASSSVNFPDFENLLLDDQTYRERFQSRALPNEEQFVIFFESVEPVVSPEEKQTLLNGLPFVTTEGTCSVCEVPISQCEGEYETLEHISEAHYDLTKTKE